MLTSAQRAGTRRSRVIGRFAVLGTVSLLAAGILSGCSGAPAPDSSGDPTESSGPRPTPAVGSTPVPVGIVIPAECEDMYLPQMFETLQSSYAPLNDATMADPKFSNTDELEKLVRSLEYLQCTWGAAGDSGIVTAVARVSEAQSAQALAAMETAGFDCYEQLDGTRCVTRTETDGDVVGESHFLRDDIWLSTFWSNAGVRGYTENMVEALWS